MTNTLLRRSLAGLAATAALSAGLLSFGPTATAGAAPKDGDVIPGSYIVTLADGAAAPAQQAAEHGRREGFAAKHVYESALRGYAADMSPRTAARLADDPSVASVVPDRVVVASAKRPSTSTPQPAEVVPSGLQRIGAARAGTVDVDVAVIDSGIASHPDLTIAGGYNCQFGPRNAYGDSYGHGTHVAGTIGARDNDIGVIGVAPGARLWAVKVLDGTGRGSWSAIICGIDWVSRNASTIEVANMSLGGPGDGSECGGADPLQNALCASVEKNVTYVVAAGNSNDDAKYYVPASNDKAITVSAMTDFNGVGGLGGGTNPCWNTEVDETFAEFSNYGTDVDLVAPGVCITSTVPGGYGVSSGTSMAAPHVAGVAALYRSTRPSATPTQVAAALVAAGDTTFTPADDPDDVAEPLLRAAGF